jgi:hypothetical protein
LLALTGEDALEEGSVGVTAAVQVADHDTDVERHGAVLGDHVASAAFGQEKPVGLAGRSGHPGAAGVEGADAADHAVSLIVGVTAHDNVGAAPGQQAAELVVGEAGIDAEAVVGTW